MPILGIDYEKCTNCGLCLRICVAYYFIKDKNQDKILFYDPEKGCNWCGQCIAGCPEDAILYEGIGESISFEGVKKPETIASYETILKFLQANRSIRHYKKKKVPLDILEKVFDAMNYAPTGANVRSETFTILSDQDKIKNLSDAVQEELLKNPAWGDLFKEQFARLEKKFHSPIYYDAPHVIFVSSPLIMELENFNIANIITYGRLAAQALGLGTCWSGWTQMAIEINPKIKRLAGISGKKMGAFMIGYPDVIYYRIPPRSKKRVKGLKK
jgi:nitroreductase/NAD-dependent dihydropyrimidine dehydrogenase PreA subunit